MNWLTHARRAFGNRQVDMPGDGTERHSARPASIPRRQHAFNDRRAKRPGSGRAIDEPALIFINSAVAV